MLIRRHNMVLCANEREIKEGSPDGLCNKGTWSFISREQGIFLAWFKGTRYISTIMKEKTTLTKNLGNNGIY